MGVCLSATALLAVAAEEGPAPPGRAATAGQPGAEEKEQAPVGSPAADSGGEAKEIDVPELVYIAGGEYTKQSFSVFGKEELKKVHVDPFHIGKYEVTEGQFYQFVMDQADPVGDLYDLLDLRQGAPNLPAVGMSFNQAQDYCNWLSAKTGKRFRLPTEEEWEFAATGTEGRTYPWGNTWNREFCNIREAYGRDRFFVTAPVGSFPKGATPEGVCDLIGNVYEWCDTPPPFEAKNQRPLKGGWWDASKMDRDAYFGFSIFAVSKTGSSMMGFRVVCDVDFIGAPSVAEQEGNLEPPLSAIVALGGSDLLVEIPSLSVDVERMVAQLPEESGLKRLATPWMLLGYLTLSGEKGLRQLRGDRESNLTLSELLTVSATSLGASTETLLNSDKGDLIFLRSKSLYLVEDHNGQVLFSLAKADVTDDAVFRKTDSRVWCVSDLVALAEKWTGPEDELYWALPAIAHYRGLDHSWCDRFGRKTSVADLLELLLDKEPEISPVAHTYYLHALAYLRYVAEHEGPPLPTPLGAKLTERLDQYVQLARRNQNSDGGFSLAWQNKKCPSQDEWEDLWVSNSMLMWLTYALPRRELGDEWVEALVHHVHGRSRRAVNLAAFPFKPHDGDVDRRAILSFRMGVLFQSLQRLREYVKICGGTDGPTHNTQ